MFDIHHSGFSGRWSPVMGRCAGLAEPCTWALLVMLGGCGSETNQSVLSPAGPAAQSIARLWWLLFWICTAVFVAVLVLAAIAIRRRRTPEAPLGDGFIIISGVIIPAIILFVLLFFTLQSTVALRTPAEAAFTVRVTGHQWWWDVRYLDHDIITANEIHIPVGQTVLLELLTADVVHSFWVPNLTGKRDMIPEVSNPFWIRADVPGVYRGQCAEYCGTQHAGMAFVVVALPPEEFETWLADRQQPPSPPVTPGIERGREVFVAAACDNCHAIRGTNAVGLIGPDLTHIGSRRTLGAGILANNTGNLAGWIMNPQPLKPGNLMPPSYLQPEDLHALVEYLESLK